MRRVATNGRDDRACSVGMFRRRREWCVAALTVAIAACGGEASTDPDDEGTSKGTSSSSDTSSDASSSNHGNGTGDFSDDDEAPDPDAGASNGECTKLDIIFVIDNSLSMGNKQENLKKNSPKFVDIIQNFRTKSGTKLDWRIAVTTTSLYATQKELDKNAEKSKPDADFDAWNGAFRKSTTCGTTQRWVEGTDADVATKFGCLAKVGTKGAGDEKPLDALELSLEDRVKDGTNVGFRRKDALLAAILMTDEDDSSTGTIDSYLQMLEAAAHGPGRWAVASIAAEQCIAGEPPNEKSFTTKMHKELVAKAGPAGVFSTICPADGDLTPALKASLNTFTAVCQSFKPPVN